MHVHTQAALTWPMKVRMPKLAILTRVTEPVPTPRANSVGLRALAGSARKVERPLMMLLPSMMGLPRISTWLKILCISCSACNTSRSYVLRVLFLLTQLSSLDCGCSKPAGKHQALQEPHSQCVSVSASRLLRPCGSSKIGRSWRNATCRCSQSYGVEVRTHAATGLGWYRDTSSQSAMATKVSDRTVSPLLTWFEA